MAKYEICQDKIWNTVRRVHYVYVAVGTYFAWKILQTILLEVDVDFYPVSLAKCIHNTRSFSNILCQTS